VTRYERMHKLPNIKKCWRCGGKAEIKSKAMCDWVQCKKCGHKGPGFFDGDDLAIDYWNKIAEERYDGFQEELFGKSYR
jgi:Zn finger protein HypA/HybF involved in hydrogenase expression